MSKIDEPIFRIAGEIESAVAAGEIVAIMAVLVYRDGNVQQKMRYTPGTRFPLLAGVTLAQHDLVMTIEANPKETK